MFEVLWPIRREEVFVYCLQKYREWQTAARSPSPSAAVNVGDADDDKQKNERSESGFDSITDGMFNSDQHNFIHIPLNIPLPPTRTPPKVPIAVGDYTPLSSPIPTRKPHRQTVPEINYIESTPSPVLRGNHHGNRDLIENGESAMESEIKVDELNNELEMRLSGSNVRKEGILADKIMLDEMENLDIKKHPKDKAWEKFYDVIWKRWKCDCHHCEFQASCDGVDDDLGQIVLLGEDNLQNI